MRTILILALMLGAVIFAVQNADVVTVDILFWRLDASLAIVVALCVIAGAIVGALVVVPLIYRMRADQRRLRAQLADLNVAGAPRPTATKFQSPTV